MMYLSPAALHAYRKSSRKSMPMSSVRTCGGPCRKRRSAAQFLPGQTLCRICRLRSA
jgi:hypothetical protein